MCTRQGNHAWPLAICSLFCLSAHWSNGVCEETAVAQVPRVAYIYSSFRDSQAYHTYDETFADLGWSFRKWEHADIDELIQRVESYDMVLFAENWNLEDSPGSGGFRQSTRDLSVHKDRWLSFLKGGGLVIAQETAYPCHLDWICALGPSFRLSLETYPNFQESSRWTNPESELDLGFVEAPWAHFREWAPEWVIVNQDAHGLPIVVYQKVGEGLIVVSTSYISRGFATKEHLATVWKAASGWSRKWPAWVTSISWGDGFIGQNEARITVKNTGPESLTVAPTLMVFEGKGKAFVTPRTVNELPAGKSTEIVLPYTVAGEGHLALRLLVKDGAAERTFFRATQEITFSDLAGLLKTLGLVVREATEACRAAPLRRWPTALIQRPLATLSSLAAQAQRWEGEMKAMAASGRAAWEQRCASVREAIGETEVLEARLKTWANSKALPDRKARFILSRATSLEKVFRDRVLNAPAASELTLRMAANEYESTQVVIIPLVDHLREVRVTCGDLLSKTGRNRISSENVNMRPVGYVCVERGPQRVWYPDPLLSHHQPFHIRADQVAQPVWVTVHAPPGTPVGKYKAELTIQSSEGFVKHLPLVVKVWDFELSKELIPSDFAFRVGQLARFFYGPEQTGKAWTLVPPALYRKYLEFFLRYRITPQFFDEAVGGSTAVVSYLKERWEGDRLLLDFDEFDRNAELLRQNGAPLVRAGYFGSAPLVGNKRRFWERFLPLLHAHLKEKGWLETSFIYLRDEPGSLADYEGVKEQAALIADLAPGLKRLDTYGRDTFEEYFASTPESYLDIWVPLLPQYRADFHQQRRRKGESVWFYVCCGPPRPNFFIYQSVVDHRILFWIMQKYGASGFLYWGVCFWMPNSPADIEEDGTPKPSWRSAIYDGHLPAGDGYLTYPAGKSIEDGLNPSIRLEAIRDGLEDFEYFRLLKLRLTSLKRKKAENVASLIKEAEAALQVDDRLVRGWSDYTQEPARIAQARERIASLIVRIGEAK